MKIAALIITIIFGLFCVIHLYFCFTENEKLRHRTKPFCLLLLALAAVLYAPTYPLIYIGALLGMLGDIFLLFKKDKRCFIIGTIVFLAGHICYMYQLFMFFPFEVPYWVQLIIFGVLITMIFVLYPFTKKLAGAAAIAGNAYMSLLLIMIVLGVIAAVNSTKVYPGIIFALGYVSFFTSDTILTITTFKKDVKRRDFYIMLAYLLAEFLIVLGLCLMI